MTMDATALALLTKIAEQTSLRYAIHIIITADLVCKRRKGTQVSTQDIKKVYTLFIDTKRSSAFLTEYQDQFLFNTPSPAASGANDVVMSDA